MALVTYDQIKRFSKEIAQTWKPVLSWRPYYGWQLRDAAKRGILLVNTEVLDFVTMCKSNLLFLLGSLAVFMVSLVIWGGFPNWMVIDLLHATSATLLGVITLYFTVAIFMATLSNQALVKYNDESAQLLKTLNAADPIFNLVYMATRDYTDAYQKESLIRAYAAESVIEQQDYVKFRSFFRAVQGDFDPSHNIEAIFSFDSVKSTTSYRAWPIKYAASIYDEMEARVVDNDIFNPDVKVRVRKLYNAANDFEMTGTQNNYGQQAFVGSRLTRVTVYGLLGVALAYLYIFLGDYDHNIMPGINFHTNQIFLFVAVLVSLSAMALAVRYLLSLLSYLRNTRYALVNYGANIWPLEGEAASYYPYYGARG